MSTAEPRPAARALVETLAAHAVDLIYCVPGESFLGAVDALHDRPDIRLIGARHESGAAFMALADGLATGRPGVALVSRGPGATNAAIAVHAAEEDAVPMVLIVGDVERSERGAGPLQEVDWRLTYGDLAKGVIEVIDPDRLPESAARALHLAAAGTPGPVVLAVPEDVFDAPTRAPAQPPRPLAALAPAPAAAARVAALLAGADRPLILAGSLPLDSGTRAALSAFAARWRVPLATTHRRPHHVGHDDPWFAGYMGNRAPEALLSRLTTADLILAIGDRLEDAPSQSHRFPAAPIPAQSLIHVWPDTAELGRLRRPEVALALSPADFLEAMAAVEAPAVAADREAWRDGLRAAHRSLVDVVPPLRDDGVHPGRVIRALAALARPDAALSSDAGNFSTFLHRWFPFGAGHHFAGVRCGAMGLGVPGAVAAAARFPGRQSIALVGDGGMLMTGQELATALQHDLPVVVVVVDNGGWGTIGLHQSKRYPGRSKAVELANPDFAALARSYGARGYTIAADQEIAPVLGEALGGDGSALVHVKASRRQVTAWTGPAD